MAFQISIGDVIALSKLAWDITQAFTSGRNSAPSEFHEVQNQLSSLTHALDALKSLSSQPERQEVGVSGSSIAPILQNCHFTLEHLEGLINKYTIIEHGGSSDKSEKRRWRDDIFKTWKKVRWTREGGDLMRLQQNLGVHLNSLNLTIAVLNSEINHSMSQRVENVQGMLGEIYDWFTDNLKGQRMECAEPSMDVRERPRDLTFSLHSKSSGPFDFATLCDNASFNTEALENLDKPIFKCNCQLRRTRYGDIHDEMLMQYLISPVSLIVRSDGLSQSWKIWLFSDETSRLTSLIIRDIAQSQLAPFEGIVSDFATTVARSTIHRETASLMVSPSMNPYTGLPVVSVLNMLSDATPLQDKIQNVKLTANGHSYSTGRIETTQLVHYRNLTGDGTWVFNEVANIVLLVRLNTHDLTEDEVCEFIINVASDTRIAHRASSSEIRISETDCCSKTKSGQDNMVRHVDANMELADMHCARYFIRQLKHLQEGLLLFSVQQMQRNEKLLFELTLGVLMVYNFRMTGSHLKLVIDMERKDYRMLISNASRSICLSINLSLDALQQLSTSNQLYIPGDGSVWVAESNLDVTNVYQQHISSTLTCVDGHAQRLLGLMLKSVARGEHAITYPIIQGAEFRALE